MNRNRHNSSLRHWYGFGNPMNDRNREELFNDPDVKWWSEVNS